jgi:hypothetical protein
MLHNTRTQIQFSTQRAADPAYVANIRAGMPLISTIQAGVALSKPSDGSTLGFYGVAQGPQRMDSVGVRTQVVYPAAGALTFALARQNVGSAVTAIDQAGTKWPMIYSAAGSIPAATAGSITIWTNSGVDTVIVAAADVTAGLSQLTFMYRYAYLPADIMALVGNNLTPGIIGEQYLSRVPTIRIGVVATDNYVTDDDWASAFVYPSSTNPQIKAVAGGLFAPGNSAKAGVAVPAQLVQAPTPADPWLIFELNAN